MMQHTIEGFLEPTTNVFAAPQKSSISKPVAGNGRSLLNLATSENAVSNRMAPYFAESVESELALLRRPNRLRSKKKLLNRYTEDLQRLDRVATSINKFLKEAILASTVPASIGGRSTDGQLTVNSLTNLSSAVYRHIEMPLVPMPLETTAELVGLTDVDGLQSQIVADLRKSCLGLAQNTFSLLEYAVQNYIFGHVKVISSEPFETRQYKAARYSYFTRRATFRYRESKDPNDADVALHVHDIVNARIVNLPGRGVPKPRWIKPLIDSVPAVLSRIPGLISIIVGDISREQVFVRSRQALERSEADLPMNLACEPGILMGNIVLTGWSPFDLRYKSKVREWYLDQFDRYRNHRPWYSNSKLIRYLGRALENKTTQRG